MLRTTIVFAAAVLLLAPCLTMAQSDLPGPAPIPAKPGQHPSATQIFRWLDADHDGFLSLAEFLAAPWVKNKAQATNFYAWMDKNKDGRVSLAEFLAAYRQYIGSSGYTVRAQYPWAVVYWRPWRYGWHWHNAWRHRPHVVYHGHHPAKHAGHGSHPGKHPKHKGKHAKPHHHAKPHKAKHPSHAHKGHAHKGHGHKHG